MAKSAFSGSIAFSGTDLNVAFYFPVRRDTANDESVTKSFWQTAVFVALSLLDQ